MTTKLPVSTGAMRAKLEAAFDPDYLEIVDESDKHRGHAGWREGGNTHFRVVMRSARFDGMSRIERSRAVHAALRDELEGGVHALALDLAGLGDGYGPGSSAPPPRGA